MEVAMVRHVRWAFPLMLLTIGIGHAADEPKKPEPKAEAKSSEMIVQFHDGTNVRIMALQDSVEVLTKYGKLNVPTADIRRVEFGLHMSEEIAKKVEDNVKDLEHNDFTTREEAGKKLVALGRFAYPSLVKASKGGNLETTRRVEGLMKNIRDKYPSYQLKIKNDDTVHTSGFIVVGTIQTPIIKARTEHFGDAQLKISDLRAMRSADGSGEAEITVSAEKFGTQNNVWMETTFNVMPDVKLVITASGMVDVYAASPGQYVSGPEGNNQLGRRGQYLPGQLLGKIGENGPTFVIGQRYEGTPSKEGKLYLHIWPQPGGGGSTGSFTVKASLGGD